MTEPIYCGTIILASRHYQQTFDRSGRSLSGAYNTMPKTRTKLTPKQAKFVIEYLVDLNATQAAIRSGYSEDSAKEIGCNNLTKHNILSAIQEQMDYQAERTCITSDYVIYSLKEVIERCLQRKPVMTFNRETKEYEQVTETIEDEDGNVREEGVWEFNAMGANKALDSLCRHLSIYNDKPLVDQSVHYHQTIIQKLHDRSKNPAALRVD